MHNKLLKFFAPIFLFFLLIFIWEYLLHIRNVPHYILPKPSLIILTIFYEWEILFPALIVTMNVTLSALFLAVFFGVIIAIIISQFEIIEIVS